MNATLTAIGIALLLGLLVALVGPLVIDWNAYRSAFEERASAIAGVQVRVLGDVDARLLPTPALDFSRVVAATPGGGERIEIERFRLDVSLMPLLRGDVLINRLGVEGARLDISVDEDGVLVAPLGEQSFSVEERERIQLAEFAVSNSRVTFNNLRNGRTTVFEDVQLTGDAASLNGPLKVAGGAVRDGQRLDFRAQLGRVSEGQGRLVAHVAAADGHVLDVDGTASFAAKPGFEGQAAFVAPHIQEGVVDATRQVRLSGKVSADPQRIVAGTLDLQIGEEATGVGLTGSGELDLIGDPAATMVLSARQIDLDRLVGRAADAPAAPPVEIARQLVGRLPEAGPVPIPLDLSLAADGVLIGRELVPDLRAELAFDGASWTIERLEAGLPGGGTLRASGSVADPEALFSGAAAVEIGNLPRLLQWYGGAEARIPSGLVRRLALTGEVEIARSRFSASDMTFTADGESGSGRIVWDNEGERPRLEAEIASERLDLDTLFGDRLKKVFADFRNGQGDADFDLKLDARQLILAGTAAREVDIDLSRSRGQIDIRRLEIGDLGGGRVSLAGRLDMADGAQAGRLAGTISTSRAEGVLAVLDAAGMGATGRKAVEARLPALLPAKLDVEVEASGAGQPLRAALLGTLDGTRIALNVSGKAIEDLAVAVDASSGDGLALLRQLGLPVGSGEDPGGPGMLKAAFSGDLRKNADIRASLTGAGINSSFEGTGRLGEQSVFFDGALSARSPDAAPLLVRLGRLPPGSAQVPIAIDGRLRRDAEGLALLAAKGDIAGRALSGDLRQSMDGRFTGSLAFDRLGAGDLAAVAFGPFAAQAGAEEIWPSGEIAPSILSGMEGRVRISAPVFDIGDGRRIEKAAFDLVAAGDLVGIDNLGGKIAGGAISGRIETARRGEDRLVTLGLRIEDADLAAFAPARAGEPLAQGRLSLNMDAAGAGSSPAAIVRQLSGSGSFRIEDALFADLSPRAFDAVTEAAASEALEIDAKRVGAAFSGFLGRGPLEAQEVSAAFALASGVARAGSVAFASDAAEARASLSLDLANLDASAELMLRPRSTGEAGSEQPQALVLFEGPIGAMRRDVDVTALTGFLTVRALDREMKRVEALEAERAKREAERAEERRKLEAEEKARRVEEERQAAARRAAEEADAKARAAKAAAEKAQREDAARARADADAALPATSLPPPLPPARDVPPPPGSRLPQMRPPAQPQNSGPLILIPPGAPPAAQQRPPPIINPFR